MPSFLLGEIFSQDPLRVSDKALTSCGPYKMKKDAMVYRRLYPTFDSSGFALNAITKSMKKDLKGTADDVVECSTKEGNQRTYQQLYNEALIDPLQSELSGDFRNAVILWTQDPSERNPDPAWL